MNANQQRTTLGDDRAILRYGRILLACTLLGAVSATAADPLDIWHLRTPPTFPTREEFKGVAYGNGRWVVVGSSGTILSSPDGVQWVDELNPAGTQKLDDIAFGGGRFVAIGSGNNVVLTSPSGREWTQQPMKVGGGWEIIYDGARFVTLAAGGYVATSIDGVTWEHLKRLPTLYVDVGGIAFGNGTYVEAGYMRTGKPTDLWSTPNLLDWEFRDAKLNQNLMDVGFGLGQFIAVGQKGTLITSPDGIEWTPQTVPHTGFIWDVCQGGSYLAAACQWGRVLTSQNGVEWTRRETGAPDHLTDIAFGNGTFVAVGWNGQIVQSEAIAPVPSEGNIVLSRVSTALDEVQFSFTGTAGQVYEVQGTHDWLTWKPLATVTCTSPATQVTLSKQAAACHFFRVAKP